MANFVIKLAGTTNGVNWEAQINGMADTSFEGMCEKNNELATTHVIKIIQQVVRQLSEENQTSTPKTANFAPEKVHGSYAEAIHESFLQHCAAQCVKP